MCMATGAAMASAGKAASSVSDKAMHQLSSAVDKLRADVQDMDAVIGEHDQQAYVHGDRLAALEEEAKKQQVRNSADESRRTDSRGRVWWSGNGRAGSAVQRLNRLSLTSQGNWGKHLDEAVGSGGVDEHVETVEVQVRHGRG